MVSMYISLRQLPQACFSCYLLALESFLALGANRAVPVWPPSHEKFFFGLFLSFRSPGYMV